MVNLLVVSVPVLSEHRMVTPANSSMAVIRVTIALYLASCWAPTARVTERTVGMAIGIPPIRRTRMSSRPRRYWYRKPAYRTKISAITNIPIVTRQKEPICARIFCKWPVVSSSWPTREAARPKKVLGPVEMTTPSASPCLQVEPLNVSGKKKVTGES